MRFKIVDGKRQRYLAHYDHPDQSHAEFRSIWKRLYGGRCPTIAEAKKWTGSDKPEIWLKHVYSVYDCRSLKPAV